MKILWKFYPAYQTKSVNTALIRIVLPPRSNSNLLPIISPKTAPYILISSFFFNLHPKYTIFFLLTSGCEGDLKNIFWMKRIKGIEDIFAHNLYTYKDSLVK